MRRPPDGRHGDDGNVYVRSKAAGERARESLERFLREKLRLEVNRDQRAVARPWERKFLGHSVTWRRQPKLKASKESVQRFKDTLRHK